MSVPTEFVGTCCGVRVFAPPSKSILGAYTWASEDLKEILLWLAHHGHFPASVTVVEGLVVDAEFER